MNQDKTKQRIMAKSIEPQGSAATASASDGSTLELELPVTLSWRGEEYAATSRSLDGQGMVLTGLEAGLISTGAQATLSLAFPFGEGTVELAATVIRQDTHTLELSFLEDPETVRDRMRSLVLGSSRGRASRLEGQERFYNEHVRRSRTLDRVSVVVPVFNEQDVIYEFHATLVPVLEALSVRWEILYVDDGSQDATPATLQGIAGQDRRVKVISLSRNFGHQVALIAGLEACSGSCVVTMDGDLQHPPACIPVLLGKWQEGFDVVNTLRTSTRGSSLFKQATSSMFYRLLDRISSLELPPGAADFRLMDRRVVDILLSFPEQEPFLRGLVQWIGFDKAYVSYEATARQAGASKFTLDKMVKLAADALFSFSFTPLRLAFHLGFISLGLSLLIFVYAVISWTSGYYVAGWTSTVIILSFFSGLQLLMLGFLAEYIGRVFTEVKQRPRYLVKGTRGFADPLFELMGDLLEDQDRPRARLLERNKKADG